MAEFVQCMARGVAPGGTLFLVAHRPLDPCTGAPTGAANQLQVSVDKAVAALEPGVWELMVAEERVRASVAPGGSGGRGALRMRPSYVNFRPRPRGINCLKSLCSCSRSTGCITYPESRISRVSSHFPAASSGEASYPIRLLACHSVQKDRLDR